MESALMVIHYFGNRIFFTVEALIIKLMEDEVTGIVFKYIF